MKCLSLSAAIVSALVLVPAAAVADPLLLGGVGFGSSSNRGALIAVDAETGAGTVLASGVGPTAGFTGLTFGATGLLYGSSLSNPVFAPGIGGPTLVRLDPGSGLVLGTVPITSDGAPLEVNDLAASPFMGMLYAASLNTTTFVSSLFTIDSTSGAATLIGATGVIGVAIAFAPNGTLYMTSATFDAGGEQTGSFLHTVDALTGVPITTTPITALPSGNLLHVGGLAASPVDGALVAAGREATAVRRGDVYRLTPGGVPSLLGSTGVGELGDLAFAPVPEPATVLLFGAGLAGLLVRRRTGTT